MLLLEKELYIKDCSKEIRCLARTRTLTLFSYLDASRKARALQFLYEAELISSNPKVNLNGSDLRKADLSNARLNGVEIKGAYFCGANLRGASFANAILRGCDFNGADLSECDFSLADMKGANLENTKRKNIKLEGANIDWTILQKIKTTNKKENI